MTIITTHKDTNMRSLEAIRIRLQKNFSSHTALLEHDNSEHPNSGSFGTGYRQMNQIKSVGQNEM